MISVQIGSSGQLRILQGLPERGQRRPIADRSQQPQQLESLNRLVDAGHTVLLIEHHLDVIKTADHVIDLGPEGHAGGQVVVTGTPEEIAACKASHTGWFLKAHSRG